MENSLGNFKEYMEVFDRYDNMAGGFIWDFVDQAIKVTEDNQVKYLYGGDFGEDKTHGYFCANGIVDCDRKPHPSLVEVKKGYQPVSIIKDNDIYTIKNKHSFLNLNHFECHVKLLRDGMVIKEDKKTLNLAPGETYDYPYKAYSFDDRMYILEFSFIRTHDEIWGGKGDEVAFEQFVLKPYQYQEVISDTIAYEVTKTHIKMTDYEVDLRTGDLLLNTIGALKLNFWRAKTDNDRGLANFDKRLRFLVNNKWRDATESYALINYNVIEKNNELIIKTELKVKGFKGKLNRTYTFTKEHVIVELSGIPTRDLERFGQSLTCPKVDVPFRWFGRGPEENYLDRKSGSKIGLYDKHYLDYGHHYMRPQENSNRSDIHWFDYHKIHIEDVSEQGLSISSYPYSQKTLDETEHSHELVEADVLTLNIDHLQKGVGGDVPGSAALHEPYKLKKEKLYHYAFKIKVSK
jgi:beta-galactosidase